MDGCFARDVVGGNKSIMKFMVMMFTLGLASRMKKYLNVHDDCNLNFQYQFLSSNLRLISNAFSWRYNKNSTRKTGHPKRWQNDWTKITYGVESIVCNIRALQLPLAFSISRENYLMKLRVVSAWHASIPICACLANQYWTLPWICVSSTFPRYLFHSFSFRITCGENNVRSVITNIATQ